ncbi:MAG: DUF1015 domain-containing protein [Planctomycetota bacterium]
MPEIRPFAAVRYDQRRFGGDLSRLIAPPYDVLDERDKQGLLARSERNIVAIDLPHIPPKSAGPAEVYERSARMLNEWLGDGTLIREASPALYAYHQQFEYAGRSYTRRMFIARVRLAPFSDGSILPHEKTFGGPKEDRLALMKATRCNLSPIFGLYADPQDRIGSIFAPTVSKSPDATAALDGVGNQLWITKDAAVIERVAAEMREKKVYIADGHHRYGTALLYHDFVAGQSGGLSADHPANFVMFVLASMDDPGCLILPYYRVLGHVDLKTILDAWHEGVAQQSPPLSKGGTKGGPAASDLVLWEGSTGKEVALRFTNRPVLHSLEPEEAPPWYDLDHAYLHRYLLDELLAKKLGGGLKIHYVKSPDDARRAAGDEQGVALLVNATPMAHLRAVSEAGGLMPQKSTYFHPKLATGFTINPLM